MSKHEYIVIGIVGVVTTGIIIATVATTHPKKTSVEINYRSLYTAEQNKNAWLTKQDGILQAENTQLTTQKAQFCSELSKAKVNDQLCAN